MGTSVFKKLEAKERLFSKKILGIDVFQASSTTATNANHRHTAKHTNSNDQQKTQLDAKTDSFGDLSAFKKYKSKLEKLMSDAS